MLHGGNRTSCSCPDVCVPMWLALAEEAGGSEGRVRGREALLLSEEEFLTEPLGHGMPCV